MFHHLKTDVFFQDSSSTYSALHSTKSSSSLKPSMKNSFNSVENLAQVKKVQPQQNNQQFREKNILNNATSNEFLYGYPIIQGEKKRDLLPPLESINHSRNKLMDHMPNSPHVYPQSHYSTNSQLTNLLKVPSTLNNPLLTEKALKSPSLKASRSQARLAPIPKSYFKNVYQEQIHEESETPYVTSMVEDMEQLGLGPYQSMKSRMKKDYQILQQVDDSLNTQPYHRNYSSTLIPNSTTYSIAGRSNGKPKINQDRSHYISNFLKMVKSSHLFIVADGHGSNGEEISQYIIDSYPATLEKLIQQQFEDNLVLSFDEKNQAASKRYHQKLKQCLITSFKEINTQLSHQQFNSLLSGSTLTVILMINNLMYTANVGDSKAILIKNLKASSMTNQLSSFEQEVFQLSVDHKPFDPKEKKRIQRMNGEVKQSTSRNGVPCGVYRVWIKDKDFPGLAMSRSIGDKLAQTVGVSPEPDVSIYKMNREDYEYLVVSASDGLWDALNPCQVKDYIQLNKTYNDIQALCQGLGEQARKEWNSINDGNTIDDITIQLFEIQ